MSFHVEISRSFRRARVFNLDHENLRGSVVEPWLAGRPVELGDREWDPRKSRLRILEGPELESTDLALGQGWHNAERSAKDVAERILGRAESSRQSVAVAVLAESPAARRHIDELLAELGVPTVEWGDVRTRALAATASPATRPLQGEALAVIVAVEDAVPGWSPFDVGLALGALGGRALVAQLGEGPLPAELRDLGVIRLRPGEAASRHALAERLRQAGWVPQSKPG